MRKIMPDLGATSDCLIATEKTEDKETCYYCFFSVISIEFYPVWTY